MTSLWIEFIKLPLFNNKIRTSHFIWSNHLGIQECQNKEKGRDKTTRWHCPEFTNDRGYSKQTCLCFCLCGFVVWGQLVTAHHLLQVASQLWPVPFFSLEDSDWSGHIPTRWKQFRLMDLQDFRPKIFAIQLLYRVHEKYCCQICSLILPISINNHDHQCSGFIRFIWSTLASSRGCTDMRPSF